MMSHHLPFTIYHLPFTIHHLPLTIHQSLFTTHSLPFTHSKVTIMQVKAFSQACENNKHPIFTVLAPHLKRLAHVVEIGSGTAQHASFFTQQLPHLTWQTTDQGKYFPQLQELIAKQNSACLPAPLRLDVSQAVWPVSDCECIFTANTLHIMPWACVEKLFTAIELVLQPAGHLFIYGPFNYGGEYTSVSNAAFDQRIKSNNPLSGIRNIEKVIALAQDAGLKLLADHSMPANNRLLHFNEPCGILHP